MGSTDFGTQVKSIGFYDPAESGVVNKRNVNVQPRGIYKGGYLTVVSDSSVSVSPMVCIIGDSLYQLRIETTVAATITGVSSTDKYIIARWSYTGSEVTDYMDILAVSAPAVNDVVIGTCVYSGATLTGFTYGDASYPRTEPKTMDLVGAVEAEATPSMYVRVRACTINYGTTSYNVANQRFGPFVAPSIARIDVIYIDSDGVVKKLTGTDTGSPTAPALSGKIVLAEVRLAAATTTIPQSLITDRRCNLSHTAVLGNMSLQNSDAVTLTGSLIGGNNQLTGILLENRTNDTGCTQNGRIWMRTDI